MGEDTSLIPALPFVESLNTGELSGMCIIIIFFFWRGGGGRAACSQSLPRHPSSLDGERRAQRVSRTCGICGSLMSQLSFIP